MFEATFWRLSCPNGQVTSVSLRLGERKHIHVVTIRLTWVSEIENTSPSCFPVNPSCNLTKVKINSCIRDRVLFGPGFFCQFSQSTLFYSCFYLSTLISELERYEHQTTRVNKNVREPLCKI